MKLKSTYQLEFSIPAPTPFILMLRPQSGNQQWISSETYKIVPHVPVTEFTDIYGNLCQRLIAPVGSFSLQTEAEVQVNDTEPVLDNLNYIEVQNLPFDVIQYLLPSRYCESDRFGNMAREITAGAQPGFQQVQAIHQWLVDRIEYAPGSSNIPISAVEVNQKQYGVCRDMAHLGISLCRALVIPARIVVGFLHELEPMDFHAWFEAYIGHTWVRFDGTQTERKKGYIAVGYGRDSGDVAVFNQFGPAVNPISQFVKVEEVK